MKIALQAERRRVRRVRSFRHSCELSMGSLRRRHDEINGKILAIEALLRERGK